MVFFLEQSRFESLASYKNLPSEWFGQVIFGGLHWTRTSDPIDVNDVLPANAGVEIKHSEYGNEAQT